MAPRGRPPIRADERRDVIVCVRVTAREADALFRFARQQRTSASAVLHRAIQRLVKSHATPSPTPSDD